MDAVEKPYASRSPVDRRCPFDRRVIDLGPKHPMKERRKNSNDRRRGWEDRYGWERISKWSSTPLTPDKP